MVGTGIWRENSKTQKMRHTHCRTWNMVRNSEKREKMKNTQRRTWIMLSKQIKVENETQTLYDPEYGEKH